MTSYCKLFSALGVAVLCAAFARPGIADDGIAKETRSGAPLSDRVQAGQLDEKTSGPNIRAGQLQGMNLQNLQGKSVGEIKDLVIDAQTGHVRYVAVTYGGFLGVGDKMFAVPFAAIKYQRDPDDADDFIAILDVTQQQLKGAVGFDQDHWPNFADEQFTQDLDKRYGVDRNLTAPRGTNVK